MNKTYNIIALLLDYPSQEMKDALPSVLPTVLEEGILQEQQVGLLQKFMDYANTFPTLRDWQSAYTELFDTASKANLYLFDFVYGTSRDRGQAMVDLQEEYLKAGLLPKEGELPDYLPVFLEYVAAKDSPEKALEALQDINIVLTKMQELFAKHEHPYEPLIQLLLTLSN